MSAEDQAIQGVIDQIWATYDVDNSGALDKEETKKFIKDTLGSLPSDNGGEFSEEAFGEVFATFDKDGSGTIEKGEMVTFIKQLLGSWAVMRHDVADEVWTESEIRDTPAVTTIDGQKWKALVFV